MKNVIEKAGGSFLRAFIAAIVVFLPGLWTAPDVKHVVAVATAGIIAAFAAGFKAVQVFVPQLTFASLVRQPYAAWIDSFTRAFLASLITALIAILSFPSLHGWRIVALSAFVGAVTAGFRAVQGAFTRGETPLPDKGIDTPPPVVAPAAPV